MSMIDIATHVKTLSAQYSAVIELAELIESIGSIEQATAEANDASAQARNQRDADVAELARIRALILTETDALFAVKQTATDLLFSAQTDADNARMSAKHDADLLLANMQNECDQVQTGIEITKAQSAELDALIIAKQDELNELTKKIAETKAAMIAALG